MTFVQFDQGESPVSETAMIQASTKETHILFISYRYIINVILFYIAACIKTNISEEGRNPCCQISAALTV